MTKSKHDAQRPTTDQEMLGLTFFLGFPNPDWCIEKKIDLVIDNRAEGVHILALACIVHTV